jgi:hypothetical protein
MPKSVHSETYNYGGYGTSRIVRDIETKLIREGNMEQAFKNGVEDLRQVISSDKGKEALESFGLKAEDVNRAIQNMENYFKNNFK